MATGGQDSGGSQGREKVLGFLEDGMNLESLTQTFAAIGQVTRTATRLKFPPTRVLEKCRGRQMSQSRWSSTAARKICRRGSDRHTGTERRRNRVQLGEGLTTRFSSKAPGAFVQGYHVTVGFDYGDAFTEASPEAYERLIL